MNCVDNYADDVFITLYTCQQTASKSLFQLLLGERQGITWVGGQSQDWPKETDNHSHVWAI